MSQHNSPQRPPPPAPPPHISTAPAPAASNSGSEPSTPHTTPRRSVSAMDALHMKLSHQDSKDSASCHMGNVSASCLNHIAETNAGMKEEDFELGKPIGYGSSAVVYAAVYKPTKKPVAIKTIDLDMFERNQIDELRRETALMALSKHPNVLQVYGSFVSGSKLHIVTPYLSGGSCLDIMKTSFRDGFEEPIIATILRQALEGLVYLHKNGHIHRDVKAGNLLMDNQGSVLLADFGVSSSLTENNELRKTFVGTPCWMAPEVMEQAGYDYKADIWSFGITSLELATGHAPFAKYPPMKVLMMTLSNDPPTLDREHTKHKYTKTFKEMIDMCLQKDPNKRPSAEKLLLHPFFKEAKKKDYLVKMVLSRVSPLEQRPHKKVPQRQVSVEATEQWDFDTPASGTAVAGAPSSPSKQLPEEKKKHITFGDVVVRNPPQPHQQQSPPLVSAETPSKSSPELAAPAPSKKSRFVVEDGASKSDSDHYQSVSSQRSVSPFEDRSRMDSPYISPVTASPDDMVPPTGLGISTSSSAPPPAQEVKRGRFSVNQRSTTASGDEQDHHPQEFRPLPVSRVSSQDSLHGERRSRFEVQQHKSGSLSHQSSVHGPSDSHVKFEGSPREPSPASSMTPTTPQKCSRFSVEKEEQQQQQQQQPATTKEQPGAVYEQGAISPECRKKGRFELTGGSSSSTANEKAEGYHDTPQSAMSSPSMSPCSTVSRDQSARFLEHNAPVVHSQMEALLRQVDSQKSLIQDMMSSLSMSMPGEVVRQRSARGDGSKRVAGGGDQEHLSRARSYTSLSSEHYGGSVEHLQHMLAASNREREKLARENDALRREIDRLRRPQSRHNSIVSTASTPITSTTVRDSPN